MKFLRNAAIGLVLWVSAIGLLVYGIKSLVPNSTDEATADKLYEREIAVQQYITQPSTVRAYVNSDGTIQSRRNHTFKAPHAGEITYMSPNFKEGARLIEGEKVLSINPYGNNAAGRAQRAAVVLEINAAEAALNNARNALKRQQSLFERGIVNQQSVEQAEDAVNLAHQTLISRKAVLVSSDIYANFDGTLRNRAVNPNQLVGNNEILGQLIDTSSLEIAIALSDNHYRQLTRQGNVVDLELLLGRDPIRSDNANQTSLVRTVVNRQTLGANDEYLLYADIPANSGLEEGEFVYVRIQLPPQSNAIRIPRTALNIDNSVWQISEDSRLQRLPLRIIAELDDSVVVEGIEGGVVIVEHTLGHLGEGSLVQSDNGMDANMIALNETQIKLIRQYLDNMPQLSSAAKERLEEAIHTGQISQEQLNKIRRQTGI